MYVVGTVIRFEKIKSEYVKDITVGKLYMIAGSFSDGSAYFVDDAGDTNCAVHSREVDHVVMSVPVEPPKRFEPVTITLKTRDELNWMTELIGDDTTARDFDVIQTACDLHEELVSHA